MEHFAGCDWMTVTVPAGVDSADDDVFHATAEGLLEGETSAGDVKYRRLEGYYGRVRGQVFYGARPDGRMVVVTGERARTALMAVWPAAARVRRLDLQVTLRFAEDRPTLAKDLGDHLGGLREDGTLERRRRFNLRHSYGDGDTLYVGSRRSDQMGRVYDKWRESKTDRFKHCWRFEVEYKKDRAQAASALVREAEDSEGFISAMVADWFEARHIAALRDLTSGVGIAAIVPRREDDIAKSLDWLARCVRPVVEKVTCAIGEDAVLWALGLRRGPQE